MSTTLKKRLAEHNQEAPASTSLYRKYRPRKLSELVGQEQIKAVLEPAIEQGRPSHAYLFAGSRGTGKTSTARILAASLNCEGVGPTYGPTLDPCGECQSCRTIAAGQSVDVYELDAASSNSVDDIRELRHGVALAPIGGKWKVYILDEAHMLTKQAWNALLKTLEEPPDRTIFILATTEAHKVPPTIEDRCQRLDFRRPTPPEIVEYVRRVANAEGIELDVDDFNSIAHQAGSFRSALGALEQGHLERTTAADQLFAVVEAIAGTDTQAGMNAVRQVADAGHDLPRFIQDLIVHLRNAVVIQTTGGVHEAFNLSEADAARLEEQAGRLELIEAVRAIDLLTDALGSIRFSADPRIQLEVALIKATRPQTWPAYEALLKRLEKLETR